MSHQLGKHYRKASRATRIALAKEALKYNPDDTCAQEALDKAHTRPCETTKHDNN